MKPTKLFLSFLIRIIPSRLLWILLLILGGSYTINNAFGKTVTSKLGGGNWSAAGTWDLGVPLATDDVVIADGDIVNVNANETCNKLTINANALGINFTSFKINSAMVLTVTTDINFQMQNGATINFTMFGPGISQLVIKGNFTNRTVNGNVTFSLDPASRVTYKGNGAQTIIAINYGSLVSQGILASTRTLDPSGTIGIAGTFTPGALGTYICTGSSIDYNGTGAQSIVIPTPASFLYNNLTISNARTTNSVTLPNLGTIKIGGAFNPTATFTTGNYIITGNTINFSGTTPQTIPAFNYNNLTSSSTGTRTLAAAGTIGVAGVFTKGGNAYTIIGSTMNFNGSAGQSVPAFNYNNIAASNTTTITFPNGGTVGVAGSFTPGTAAYTVTGNTVDFNGSGSQTIPAAFNFNNLTSSSTGARTLAPAGTISVTAVFTPGTNAYTTTGSTINFVAAGAQAVPALPGSANYNNITVSGGGTKTLGGNSGITGVLTVAAGTFNVNGKTFTLISNASGTASIAALTGGADIVGLITIQRWTGNGPTDWRFLCSAVNGQTLANWMTYFAMSGFTGATCNPGNCASPGCSSTCTYVSVYTYNETKPGVKDSGFVAASNVTNPIVDGKGYWVYLGANPITFAVTGLPNKQAKSASVTYTNTGSPANDGWNVVSNPYPSAINWDAATDATHWTKTNIGGTIYIWNSSTGSFASYSLGAPVNGGSNLIASQQAYWVQAIGTPTLTARELVKSNVLNTTYLKTANTPNTSHIPMAFKDFPIPLNTNNTPNSIKFTASGNGNPDDETLIRFIQGATNNFDNQYDGWKLAGYYSNLSSVMDDSLDYSINSLPPITSTVDIPIRFKVPTGAGGTYTIRRDSILMMPMSSCLIFEDKTTGSMIDLRTTISYSFTISDTTVAPRFVLHIYAPMTKKSVSATCGGGNNGMAIATGTGTGPWTYVWKNSAGVIVKTTPASSTADTLFNCASDTYSVSVNSPVCGTVTDTIIVNAPAVLTNNISQTNISCFGGHNGTAAVTAIGGSPAYSYLWSNSQTTTTITNLSSGNYSVTTTDAHGCTATSTVAITQPAVLTAGFSASTYTLDIAVNNDITFTNNSLGASSYQWDFGDTSGIYVSVDPLHFYNYTGTYTVTLIASNGTCSDTLHQTIVVINSNALAVNAIPPPPSSVNVLYDNGEVFLLFSLDKTTQVNIIVYNMMGQELSSQNNLLVKNEKIKLDLRNPAAGIYVAVSEMLSPPDSYRVSKKIFIPAAR